MRPSSTIISQGDPAAGTLVLFCRRPRPGIGKQRLAGEIGVEGAHRIAEALLDCALEDAAEWPGEVVVAPAAAIDSEWAAGVMQRPVSVLAQPASTFGERLEFIDAALRARGQQRVTFIGSDAPTLDRSFYDAARAALTEYDVVLGPALDGGVTLMGARVPWSGLPRLPWSQDTLHASLAESCRAAGSTVATLPQSFDVDTLADLRRAAESLRTDPRPARRRLRELLNDPRCIRCA